jgi:hypothetical protein
MSSSQCQEEVHVKELSMLGFTEGRDLLPGSLYLLSPAVMSRVGVQGVGL